jgi:hypothetical protein
MIYNAFLTNPERKHLVQILTLLTAPVLLSTHRILCRFGYHTFLVLLFAWLTLFPTTGPLPQTSHTLDMNLLSPFEILRSLLKHNSHFCKHFLSLHKFIEC